MKTPANPEVHNVLMQLGFIPDNDPNGHEGYTHIAGKGFIYVDEKTTLHDIPVLLWKDGYYNGRHDTQMAMKIALGVKG